MSKFLPTEQEIFSWLLSTLQHVCHVEYFLEKLDLGLNDLERPHDITGIGNKFEWEVMYGFAMQYREPQSDFRPLLHKSLGLHRKQFHHVHWNGEIDLADAVKDNMLLGAVDAICSLLENRQYQGGAHTYREIRKIAKSNSPHKAPWMLLAAEKMMNVKQPNIELINSIFLFPNIGISNAIFERIIEITIKAIFELKQRGYFNK